MKIGFFDSWIWARFVMEAFRELFPHDEMLIFSDTKNCPYGDRSTEQIREFTFAGVKHLFEHEHCDVVILACNTAAAVSIRWLQREAMPGRHLLSITIPGIEALAAWNPRHVAILATTRTVESHVYAQKIHDLFPEISSTEIACPGLVEYIEQWEEASEDCQALLRSYLLQIPSACDTIVLGCTHFPKLAPSIQKQFPRCVLIDPGKEAALRFVSWRERHKIN